MQTYELLVVNRAVKPNSKDMTLVRTSVGIDQIHVMFDNAEWLDFPVTVTFSQGEDMVTQQLELTSVTDSDEYVAESTVLVPHEVIDTTGTIKVTFQGTDSEGRHIITALGYPLRVEEAGDVTLGDIPEDAPTIDQWNQAYAQAMEAISNVNAAIEELASVAIATSTTLGMVMPDGTTITVTEEGVISATQYELPIATSISLGGVMPDGETITVEPDGTIHGATQYELPVATTETIGGVRPDGSTVNITSDGVISASTSYTLPTASQDVLGGVMIGDGLSMSNGVVSVDFFTEDEIVELTPMGDYVISGDETDY